jgi:four helix bundle protein
MNRGYKDLVVWRKGLNLSTALYAATEDFPRREMFGLTDQLRRAGVSIPSNIAEGHAHATPRDFMKFLRQARGSAAEIETQLLLVRKLGYLPREKADTLLRQTGEVARLLSGLISSLGDKPVTVTNN